MTLSLDIRRLGLMLLTLLVALAVIGPSCLMFATEAVAMSSSHSHVPVSGCEDSGSSMGTCPHEDPVETTAAMPDKVPVVLTLLAIEPAAAPVTGFAPLLSTEQPPGAPVSHLTPLRL